MVDASRRSGQISLRILARTAAFVLAVTALAACGRPADTADSTLPNHRLRLPRGGDRSPSAASFSISGPVAGVALEEVLRLPSIPIYFVSPPGDDRLFIVQRNGAIRILKNGSLLPGNFLDLTEKITEEGEGGLLSMAFHPRYAENGLFFVNYTDTEGDTVIARYHRSGEDPDLADSGSATRLLWIDQPYSNHNGGQLQFGPDGYLYIGMGDGGSAGDPSCNAQRRVNLLGKMLRIDVDHPTGNRPYAIPPDNPFLGPNPLPDEAWAIGLRNPWRFSFDRATGDLWIGDVGQNRMEEIDFQAKATPSGRNYGWKPMEGTLCFADDKCEADTPSCNAKELTLPVLEYPHEDGNCSVTGGYVYRGRRIPSLVGSYLFGDYCSGRVWAAKIGKSGFDVQQLSDLAMSVVTFGEDRDGEIWLGTFEGKVLRLVAKDSKGGGK
ncbi:MAG: PQQ-dependent sugar dehydrogenase [Acidobacteriota bacterium]